MITIVYKTDVPHTDHHDFDYVDGKKIPKKDSGFRYFYIDRNGLMHGTQWEDDASLYGGGVYAITDEFECKEGLPFVNGRKKEIREGEGKSKVVVYHGDPHAIDEVRALRQLYSRLMERKAEVEKMEVD